MLVIHKQYKQNIYALLSLLLLHMHASLTVKETHLGSPFAIGQMNLIAFLKFLMYLLG